MANDLGIDMSWASGAISGAGSTMYYLLLISAIGAVILYFMWFMSFNKKIILKKVINGSIRRITYKCKIIVKKDGQSFLQFRYPNPMKREIHPAPPLGVIELDGKREVIFGYLTSTGEIIYAKDTGIIPEIPQEILNYQEKTIPETYLTMVDGEVKSNLINNWRKENPSRQEKIDQWKKENRIIEPYKPITTNQRTFYLNQIKQANNKTQLTIMDRISQMAPMMMLVIMLTVVLIFGGKLYEPATALASKVVEHDKLVLQMQEKTDNIDKNVQKLVNEKENLAPPPPQ